MRDQTGERKIGECKNGRRRAASGLCERVSRWEVAEVTEDVVGDDFAGCKGRGGCWGRRARAVVAVESTREGDGGNCARISFCWI